MNEQKQRSAGTPEDKKGQTFFLVRHGNLGLKEKIYLGQTDIPLSREGQEQARKLGEWFCSAGHFFQRIYVSPIGRCVQSLDAILDGMSYSRNDFHIQTESDLAEIDLGDWDGRSVADIKREHPIEYQKRGAALFTYRTPGGESFEDLSRRAVPCFLRITANAGNALIVAHAGVNRMILKDCMVRDGFLIEDCAGRFIGPDPDDFMHIPQPEASCYIIHKIPAPL